MKNSSGFVHTVNYTTMGSHNTIISFDVLSLFTKIPFDKSMEAIKKVTSPDIAKLIKVFILLKLFCFLGELYEHTSKEAMSLPLSSIMENLFVEYFQSKIIDLYPFKPKFWKWHIYNTMLYGRMGVKNWRDLFIT